MRQLIALLREFDLRELSHARQHPASAQRHALFAGHLGFFRHQLSEQFARLALPEGLSQEGRDAAIFAALPADLSTADFELLYKLKLIIEINDLAGNSASADMSRLAEFYRALHRKILAEYFQQNLLTVLENYLVSARRASESDPRVAGRLDDIIYIIRRWRLGIDDRITVELIEQIRNQLRELSAAANAKKYLFVAIEIINAVGDSGKIHERIAADLRRFPAPREEVIAYNRHVLKVDKARELVFKIHEALVSKDKQRILLALHHFSLHVSSTIGKEYRHGIRIATAKEIRDFTIDDYASVLLQTLGEDVKDLIIPNEKLFRAVAEAIHQACKDTADDTEQNHQYHSLMISLKNGCQFFEKVLCGRGVPEKLLYGDEYEKIYEDFRRTLPQYDKSISSSAALMEYLVRNVPLQNIQEKIDQYFPGLNESKNAFRKNFTDYMIKHAYQIHQWQLDLVMGQKIQARENAIYSNIAARIPATFKDYIFVTEGYANADAYDRFEKNSILRIRQAEIFARETRPEMVRKAKQQASEQANNELSGEKTKASNDIFEQYVKNIKKLIEDLHDQWKVGRIGGETIDLTVNGVVHRRTVAKHVAEIYAKCLQAENDHDWNKHFHEIAVIGLKASKPHRFDFFSLTKRDALTQSFYDKIKGAYVEKNRIIRGLVQ